LILINQSDLILKAIWGVLLEALKIYFKRKSPRKFSLFFRVAELIDLEEGE